MCARGAYDPPVRVRRIVLVGLLLSLGLLSACAPTVSQPVGPVASADPTGCGRATRDAGTTTSRTLQVDGRARTYAVHLPAGYDAARPTPVVLAFHGHGMAPSTLEAFSGFDDGAAIAVYPQASGTSPADGWQGAPYASGADDVAFVSDLLDDLEASFCVDPAHIGAAGISNGGGFVSLLSCALPGRIAAFAVVAGAIYPAHNPPCPSARPVPVIEFHGTADPVIAYGGGTAHGTAFASVDQWLDEQVHRDGCASTPSETRIGADVVAQTWSGCRAPGAVVHYRIDGGGHTWPGAAGRDGPGETTQTISATTLIERFFAAHPLA